ncbi:DNA-dependent helicase II [Anatilimnocola aggregata]|uniref:DNA 3'-5' helicase n=1 Tax=Anatilimnocola aggregata TaxID=2528021 RepID=A0A517YFF7_9BACT|nr:UvrD-helicase domain-containing protein [Anatilimnocola aggregata]QDU28882.1 DNA-dependent helicase II [Anatilimnocola aggregata]
MSDVAPNPAQLASQEAWTQLQACLDQRHSFIFEAGAGAGKTYSLIEALRYLIKRDGVELIRNRQQVACITYTNVATKEIETRTDQHPAIYSSTIHSFCWTLIQGFQPFLRNEIPNIKDWPERLKESAKRAVDRMLKERVEAMVRADADQIAAIEMSLVQDRIKLESVGTRNVEYSLGHSRADKTTISLGHNDVLVLAAKLLGNEKFRRVLVSRFPVVFIDEYQDTDNVIFNALKAYVIGKDGSPLIGFFGDHWQKIYGTGCGRIEHPMLKPIGKKANFRSVPAIVDCLNRLRRELPQAVEDPSAVGEVVVFHTNEWKGERQTGAQWKGDLPDTVAHSYLQAVLENLAEAGWNLAPETSKILMLTHNVLAAEQGYRQLADALPRTESFIKKEDPHIAFLVDTVEPVCGAFARKRYGEMFAVFGAKLQVIGSHGDKAAWSEHLASLVKLRESETIGTVVDHVCNRHLFPVPDAVERKERALKKLGAAPVPDEAEEITRLRQLRAVPYKQVAALRQFIEEKTPFSTKHGVKGLEFENVLVVFGRGWNLYNFAQFLEWSGASGIPSGKTDTYERSRNLFYVACSRPKKRLALLFTQELTPGALATLAAWFGAGAIRPLPNL